MSRGKRGELSSLLGEKPALKKKKEKSGCSPGRGE